jgi:hypothetical protein
MRSPCLRPEQYRPSKAALSRGFPPTRSRGQPSPLRGKSWRSHNEQHGADPGSPRPLWNPNNRSTEAACWETDSKWLWYLAEWRRSVLESARIGRHCCAHLSLRSSDIEARGGELGPQKRVETLHIETTPPGLGGSDYPFVSNPGRNSNQFLHSVTTKPWVWFRPRALP